MHAGSGSSSSLLGRLTAAKDDDGNALNTDEIIDNVLTLLFAGSDTTASGLTSSLKELALAPALQAQLRQALRDADEADEALDAFLAEVHRRNPPAPFQMRLVGKEDLAVGGYKVSANSLVVYGYAGTLLADAKAYPDPDAFDPSRWKPQGAAPNWAFGGGPRMCPGRMLALAESRALLKRVLGTSGFTWHLVDGQDLQGRYSPGLFPADRLLARIAHTGAANE